MKSKLAYEIAQILMAAESKSKKARIADQLRNEAYQRTMSDEYPPEITGGRASQPREPVSEETRRNWEQLR